MEESRILTHRIWLSRDLPHITGKQGIDLVVMSLVEGKVGDEMLEVLATAKTITIWDTSKSKRAV